VCFVDASVYRFCRMKLRCLNAFKHSYIAQVFGILMCICVGAVCGN
jgi:mannitol-1-phosphate/altronate dehydrogenase